MTDDKKLITVEVVFYNETKVILAVQLVRTWGLCTAYGAAFNILSRDFPQTSKAIETQCTSFSAVIVDKG